MGSPYRQRHQDGTYTEQTTTKAKAPAKTTSSTPKTTTAKTTTRPDTQT